MPRHTASAYVKGTTQIVNRDERVKMTLSELYLLDILSTSKKAKPGVRIILSSCYATHSLSLFSHRLGREKGTD